MSEQGTYAEYKVWDQLRRVTFPTARHWIYRTKLGDFTVAEWCPLTGHQRVGGGSVATGAPAGSTTEIGG